jgi:hypothetical protein
MEPQHSCLPRSKAAEAVVSPDLPLEGARVVSLGEWLLGATSNHIFGFPKQLGRPPIEWLRPGASGWGGHPRVSPSWQSAACALSIISTRRQPQVEARALSDGQGWGHLGRSAFSRWSSCRGKEARWQEPKSRRGIDGSILRAKIPVHACAAPYPPAEAPGWRPYVEQHP